MSWEVDSRQLKRTPPPSPFFVSAYSKGLTRVQSVSADSKGLICTKIVQNPTLLGSAHSKGFSSENERPGNKKAAVACRCGYRLTYMGLYLIR